MWLQCRVIPSPLNTPKFQQIRIFQPDMCDYPRKWTWDLSPRIQRIIDQLFHFAERSIEIIDINLILVKTSSEIIYSYLIFFNALILKKQCIDIHNNCVRGFVSGHIKLPVWCRLLTWKRLDIWLHWLHAGSTRFIDIAPCLSDLVRLYVWNIFSMWDPM